MNARIGRMAELDALVEVIGTRTFEGDARVKVGSALEGLSMMHRRPEVSFRCGPYALLNVGAVLAPETAKRTSAFLNTARSTPTGFSLTALSTMDPSLGLKLQMARRALGAGVIVPSVVHWNVGHFAAIVREQDGMFLVQDSTFGNETWLRREALDVEDQRNRLVRELHGAHESAYDYDGESRRVRIRELNGGGETKNEIFIWCGTQICQKRGSDGASVVRSYFNEGFKAGVDDYFYARDHLGSVRDVVAVDGVTVSGRVTYSPWGEASETGSVLSDFGYAGQYVDRATGLNLAQYRGYSPALGRWMSVDPIGLEGGINLYAYVNDDPINYIDSDGRFAIAALGAGIVLAAGYLTYVALQNHARSSAHPPGVPGFPHMP